MSELELYPYDFQELQISELSNLVANGKLKLVNQLNTGGGKCLGKNTPILMYDGNFKLVQNIEVGDLLMGVNSIPRIVLSTCSGIDNMYKIKPLKGKEFVCNEPHILSLVCNATHCGFVKDKIYNIPLNEYLKLSKSQKHILKLYRSSKLDFNNKKYDEQTVEPYLLGIWLGDGTSKDASFTNMDKEIIDYLYNYISITGEKIRVEDNKGSLAKIYHITNDYKRDGLLNKLRKLKLINDKHIPDCYKFSSEEKRLELLAGLIDTDGYLHHNGYEIHCCNEVLARDIIYLTRSLGFNTNYIKKIGVKGFRITFYGNGLENIPIKIQRKKATKREQLKNVLRSQFTVESIGKGEYFGFEIDGDRLFIINEDLTVTHNTVEFATITFRYNTLSNKRVFIMVHRDELLNQTIATLKQWYNIEPQEITKGNKHVYDRDVYVGMIETCFRRLSSNINYFPEVGLVLLDEAHEGNFKKIHQFFPNAIIIAFTATPIYSDRKTCMKDDYDDIVVGPQVNELIMRKALCQNITYSISEVNRAGFKVKGNDFDIQQMSKEFSKHRHVKNTLELYEQIAPDTKTICFNVNVDHSKIMTEAFRSKGYDVRHVDGNTPDDERDEILNPKWGWFSDPRPTILCNVGITTMGYDNRYVRNIIDNFSTLSLTKWLQTAGRGGRTCPEIGKEYFSILDLGGNARYHGDWNMDRDWRDLFFNPPKKRSKTDAAPYKDCPKCRALIAIQARECPYCHYVFPIKAVQYDTVSITLELITKNLNVQYLCEVNSSKNEFYTVFLMENNLVTQAKYKLGSNPMTETNAKKIIEAYLPLAQQWAETMGKDWNRYKPYLQRHITDKIEKTFGYRANHISNIEKIEQIHGMFTV